MDRNPFNLSNAFERLAAGKWCITNNGELVVLKGSGELLTYKHEKDADAFVKIFNKLHIKKERITKSILIRWHNQQIQSLKLRIIQHKEAIELLT